MTDRPSLRLDQFLKFRGIAASGGQAKVLIQDGRVQVNGELETKRRRRLADGDIVHFDGNDFAVSDSEN